MTSSDLKEHIGIIDQLKSLLNSADFDQMFSLLTSDLPKSKQFLLKMELKRISQPCQFYIDLRGHVDGEVKPYVYLGKTHYMDENAVKVFESGLKQFGSFTIGVYEDVLNTDNNYRVMHRKETEQRVRSALKQAAAGQVPTEIAMTETVVKDLAAVVQFGLYTTRRDERMNYSIDVEIQNGTQKFSASTSDLSVSGCKLKVSKLQKAKPGQQIRLFFTGLEQEFVLDLANGVPYTIVDVETQANFSYWRMKREEAENEPQFAQFLQNFITGNKRRYKVNLDNVSECLITKGYEQFYVPRLIGLPVFIAVREGVPVPICALTTDYNKVSWQYFLDEQHQSVLMSIISAKRLKTLLQQADDNKTCVLYCFTHAVKGKLYFYSATNDELAESPQLTALFLGFGAAKPSWRVFHFNLLRTSVSDAEQPAIIPDPDDIKPAGISSLVKGFIQDLRYIVNLTDITTTDSTFWYQNYSYAQDQLKLLAQFGHKKRHDLPQCEAVPVQYVNLRSESRYLYKTAVNVQQADGKPDLTGHSRDFSSKGLQLETALPVSFQKGDIILLSMPDMQKISSKHTLTGIAYEIMAVSKSRTIMNLRVSEGDTPHSGRLFFQQLIQSNRAKLTLAEESPRYPGLSPALRNMYLCAQNNVVLYLQRKGIRYEMNTIARGQIANTLFKLLALNVADTSSLDLSLLLRNSAASLQFAQQLKQMKRFDNARNYEVFISIPHNSDRKNTDIQCKYDYEFTSEQDKQRYVATTMQQNMLFCFRLMLSRTGRPDTDYIAKELNYISTYAIHKAKALEEELWSVAGVIDVVDISTEIALRYATDTNAAAVKKAKQLLLND